MCVCKPKDRDYSKYAQIQVHQVRQTDNAVFSLSESLEMPSFEKHGHTITVVEELGMRVLKLKLVPVLPMTAKSAILGIMVAIKAKTDKGLEIFPIEDYDISPTGMIEAKVDADHILSIDSVLIKKCCNKNADCSCKN